MARPTPTSTDLQQHTWNRLIEDFIGAVRNDDKDQRFAFARLLEGCPTTSGSSHH